MSGWAGGLLAAVRVGTVRRTGPTPVVLLEPTHPPDDALLAQEPAVVGLGR